MHRLLKLIPVVAATVACAKTETPPDAATTDTVMTPAVPTIITETDIAGTWTGTTTSMTSDSVLARWRSVCAAGVCRGGLEGSKETVDWTYTLAGDSAAAATQPYMDSSVKARVIDAWVARTQGDLMSGSGALKLASNPDSVVLRYRFTGTRKR